MSMSHHTLASSIDLEDAFRLQYSEDGGMLTVVSHNAKRSTFDMIFGRRIRTLPPAMRVTMMKLDERKVTLSRRGVKSIDVGFEEIISAADTTRDDRIVAVGSADGTVAIINAVTECGFHVMRLNVMKPVFSLGLSPGGDTLAVGTDEGTVIIVDTQSGEVLRCAKVYAKAGITTIQFARHGRFFACGAAKDTPIRILDAATLERIGTLKENQTTWSLSFDATGKHLASGTFWGEVSVWRVYDGALLGTYAPHGAGIVSMAFSPDNRTLASICEDGRLVVASVPEEMKLRYGYQQ